MSVSGVFLVLIFTHSDWILRDTQYLSVLSPNAQKILIRKTPNVDTFYAVHFKKKKKSEGFQLFTWFLMQLPETISNPFMNFLASFHGMFALIHDVQIEIIPLITCICNTVYGKFHKHLLRMYLIAFIKAYYKCNFKFDQLAFLISCICNTLYNFRNNLPHIYLRSIAKSYYNKI